MCELSDYVYRDATCTWVRELSVAFNSFSPNLLASGAADGELVIWDLTDPAAPSLFPALVEGG